MHIVAPDKIAWRKDITDDPLDCFGSRDRARLRATLRDVETMPVRYTIEPLTEAFFDWFIPMYEERITGKDNPRVFDVRANTLHRTDTDEPYYALTVYENEREIGGTIFRQRADILNIAYRVYAFNWESAKLKANPSFYSEYLITEYARDNGFPAISHGKDRNPYGINSNIGLAIFKLAAGCYPYVPTPHEVTDIDLNEIERDALVFHMPEAGTRLQHAYLVTDRATETKYIQVQKYPDVLSVDIHYRD